MKSKDRRTVDCGLVLDSAHLTDQYVVAVTVILLIKIAGSQVCHDLYKEGMRVEITKFVGLGFLLFFN